MSGMLSSRMMLLEICTRGAGLILFSLPKDELLQQNCVFSGDWLSPAAVTPIRNKLWLTENKWMKR